MRIARVLVVPLLTVAIFATAAGAAPAGQPATPWPRVDSDLPARPDLLEGTLSNGVRYLILPNAEPKGHVSLRLLVAAGSLVEGEDERGLAHFVEHMAFRGTRTHPDDSLVPALHRLGVGFGPDSAAFTGYDHTIFHLELAQNDEATLREAVGIFRELASEVTFEPRLIEAERGVVLSEAKTRDTATARRDLANIAFLFPAARLVHRVPIGDVSLLQQFRREQFIAFYDAWYRPERFVVIVVGEVEPTLVRRIVADEFGGLTARAAARPEPGDVVPAAARRPDIAVFSDPGLIGCAFIVEHPQPRLSERDTHRSRALELHLALANAMFQRRLLKRSLQPQSTFVSPQVQHDDDSVPGWQLTALAASGNIADWARVAADLEREHRRAFLYGFAAAELEEARSALAARYAEARRTAATWGSDWIAGQLVTAVRFGRVVIRPADAERDMAGELANASLNDCLDAFRSAWTTKAPHVFVAAHPQFRVTAPAIAAVLNVSRQEPVQRKSDQPAEKFAYGAVGPPGEWLKDDYLPDLEVRLAEFRNGVRCNFKPTKFEADSVLVHVRVGDGKLAQPEGKPGLDLLARAMLLPGGLGRHSIDALSDLLSVSTVKLQFEIEDDACVFTAHCSRRDLPFCLQLLTAYLTDAAYRPDALRAAQGGFGSMYAALEASPAGPLSIAAGRVLAGGDRRFGLARPPELNERTLPEVKAWLAPQFERGPIEVSVVGDVEWAEAAAALGPTFGALPRRATRRSFPDALRIRPPPAPVGPTVYPLPPLVKQCGVAWYWPVPPLRDVREERRYRLLSSILGERLRIRLREQLGATYTPTAGFENLDGFPWLNWVSFYAEVDPVGTMSAMQLIEREAMGLMMHGPSAEEFERAKRVYVRAMTDDLRSNAYWGATVLGDAQQRPARIAAARSRAADIAGITREELATLAQCFDASTSFRFITTPWPSLPAAGGGKDNGSLAR